MYRQLLLVCLIVGHISAIGLVPPICLGNTVTLISNAPTISRVSGTLNAPNSTAYSTTTGQTFTWSSGSGGDSSTVSISGWPQNDTTVMEVSIEQVTVDAFRNITVSTTNTAGKVIVPSSFTSPTTNKMTFYFGFKASQGSILLDAVINGSTGSFIVKVYGYGWNDGTTCQTMCSKTLYPYSYLGSDIVGQYDCFEKNLIASGILILLALLF